MSLQQKLSLKLQQKMILTPSLQQAIRLLQLTRIELLDEVALEVQTNPVLEEANTVEEPPALPGETPESAGPAATEAQETSELAPFEEKIDVENYFQDYVETAMKYRGASREVPEDAPDSDRYASRPESLAEHLEWQISLSRLSPADQEVARAIAGNLREDGYLSSTLEELAAQTGAGEEVVRGVLPLVQRMDPVGTACRDLRECLLVQLDELGQRGSLAWTLADSHLPDLERGSPEQLAPRLNRTAQEIRDALQVIRTLDPKPGLRYNNPVNPVIEPDVLVEKDGDGYRVRLNEDGLPRLRLSPHYRAMAEDRGSDQEAHVYLKEKVRSALWFLKGIEERQRTILNVAKEIVEFQREFLDKGPAHMRPLILRDVAERVGVHESTVSRVASNKYMQTPRGILAMKYFFNTGISTLDGVDVSALRVKERIKALVEGESHGSPMSDQRIADILKREGVLLARRTVAKYREELHIHTSARRKARTDA
jgi:RNA polymerase sigma-54 factor